MENATKALLIAGSVLIALLLIAVGLRIFNSTKGTAQTAQSTMQTTEVTMFNNQFIQYQGLKSKREALELINKVAAIKATNKNLELYVVYGGYNSDENLTNLINALNNSTQDLFNIAFTRDEATSRIKSINIA